MNKKRNLFALAQRFTVVTLSASLVLGTVPTSAFAATSDELKSQLEAAQAQSAAYQEQTAAAFAEFEAAQSELESLNTDIESIQSNIETKQAELETAQDTLSEYEVADYKSSSSFLDIVLSSTSFEEFFSRYNYASKVASNYSEQIQNVRSIKEDLNADKSELETKQAEQQKVVDEAQSKAESVQAAQSEHEAYIASLSEEVQTALAEEEAAAAAAAEAAAAAAAAEAEAAATTDTSASDTTTNNSSANNTSNNSSSNNSSSNSSSGNTNYGSGISGVINAALSQIGVSYSWGGNAIEGVEFDCSGLVWWAFKKAGYSVPRGQRMSNGRSSSMIGWALDSGRWTTDPSQLQPGDAVFYGSSVNSTGHVGLYIGNGQIVHSSWGGVETTSVTYSSNFVGGGPLV